MRSRSRSTTMRVATRLHPAGGQAGLHLLPEDGGDLVAVQAVEDAAGLLGVDQAAVDLAGLVDGPLDGLGGDLVEDHAAHGHARGGFSTSSRCQAMASPSRSSSVARYSSLAAFSFLRRLAMTSFLPLFTT